ncbi:nucleoside phosphorylase domain-containing protein [Elsinoe ampelina]|uniref:Nucleoside phosphorylase domain-containing protein n=1 Tax=Elsinoe ampelina TaxID=302913 RepID=A0A6A6GMG8_9PEZI|nr:nucleoside phosphorylase domain-containing protein [Elsinoe ampelina]
MRHQDYHVGWICALATELAAAISMLDEEHEPLDQFPGDDNSYKCGRIGRHNVVIACLPAGVYGTTSAANVAGDMMRSFPGVRIGLMVGVGGGIPTRKTDIRLGDIVVGRPTDTAGGVVQFDMGRVRPGGFLQPTGMLNRPPDILLNALNTLMANHQLRGSRIPAILRESAANNSRWRRASAYPGASQDRLFQHDYHHVGTDGDCESCDLDQLVPRNEREDAEPVVHYGIVASGNQVVRDGVTREKVRRELRAMCFEMEAAGLVSNFRCLVIRGICDYSDSHKNKDWQPYAAAVAAACAKELLESIAPQQAARVPEWSEGNHVNGGDQFTVNNYGTIGSQVGKQTSHGPMYFGTVNNHYRQ